MIRGETQRDPKIRELSEKKNKQTSVGDVSHCTDKTAVWASYFKVLLQAVPRALELSQSQTKRRAHAGTAASSPLCDLSFFLVH